MTSHHNLIQGSSSRNRKSTKVNDKAGNKKNLLISNNGHLNSAFNSQAFEIPAITTNGMKNIEHFIDKALVEGKQWYRCKWQSCTYSTIRSDSIVRHMRKHTGERPYKCWFCSYATIQSSALKIHMRRHTGERPYVCKYDNCGKRFAVLNTLVVHERTHTGYKPYKCSFSNTCNYSSSDRCKLVNHMRKSHQIELDANKVPSSVNNISGQLSTSAIFPGSASNTVNSSSNSLALVSSAMSSSQLLMSNSMYSPFSVQNSSQMLVNNSLNNNNQLKHSTPSSSTPFMPLNLLSVISGGGNYENLQNTENSSTNVKPSGRSKRKSMSTIQANIENKIDHSNSKQFNDVCQSLSNVKREDNSIKRVMVLIDKRIANNRTSYFCKWPSCGYESLRSDSIVRHMRSHTGERPYKCNYENCNYATIQRSTLNKHLTRHQTNIFNFE